MHCIALKSMGEQTRNHLNHYLESISSKQYTTFGDKQKSIGAVHLPPHQLDAGYRSTDTVSSYTVPWSVYRSTHSEPSMEWVVGYKYKTKRQQIGQNTMSNKWTTFRR